MHFVNIKHKNNGQVVMINLDAIVSIHFDKGYGKAPASVYLANDNRIDIHEEVVLKEILDWITIYEDEVEETKV